ncbi:MAG: hypothetical protein HYU51_03410 [Candidatus Rokubacteria bacterium]|nr:hypothetical protein [Candidatus Rokubacteria bacterium]
MNGPLIWKALPAVALAATLISPAPSAAQQPAPAVPQPSPPAPQYVLSVQGLYPNIAEAGDRRIALMVAYGIDGHGIPMRRLAIVDVTPGNSPRGIQRVFEPGRAKVTISSQTWELAMTDFFNQERNVTDLEVTLTALEKIGGVEQPTAVIKTSLADLSEVRARQAREANQRVKFGDETYWVSPGFFGDQSGFLFFDDATIKRLADPTRDPMALEPRFVVMTTERRGVFNERLADSVPVGATGYVVAWDYNRFAWVAKRAGQ